MLSRARFIASRVASGVRCASNAAAVPAAGNAAAAVDASTKADAAKATSKDLAARMRAYRAGHHDALPRLAKVTAVLGSQWGDEGKGKLVDVLAQSYKYVARFNGGANAGHTVVVDGKKFAFHLLPCGLIYPHTINVLGNGTVIHLPSLFSELDPLDAAGIAWQGRLKISNRAHVLFDYHKQVDGLLEDRLKKSGGKSIGTTKQGIGPAYTSKAQRTTAIRMGDFVGSRSLLHDKLRASIESHKLMYGIEVDTQAEIDKADAMALKVKDMVVDTTAMMHDAIRAGEPILTEGANAAMLDVDFGTFPFVTSSTTTAGGICTGLGIPPSALGAVVGVVKAYTTRVGGGPFPTELTDERGGGERPLNSEGTEIGLQMQQVGREVGVTTGRKRRCGWFDAVVVRYAHGLNNFSSLNITKLDVLDGLKEVKIATKYTLDGKELGLSSYPATLEDLARVQVEYVTLPGWEQPTTGCKTVSQLPKNAQAYVEAMRRTTGVPISYIGVGPGREDMIPVGFRRRQVPVPTKTA